MIEVPLALAILATGAALGLVLARCPRAALFASLTGVGASGMLCTIAGLRALATTIPQSLQIDWPLPIGSAVLIIDGLSAWFLLAIGLVGTAVAIYSWGYLQSGPAHEPVWVVGALLNVLVAALVITVCAADVILFLIGWELMSLSAFLLVGFQHRDKQTRQGAWMYLIATHLGTALGVLPVFGAFAARSGTTSFAGFAGAFESSPAAICMALFFLGLLGFGTKAGIMPMHVWLPAAHPVAPSPVSAMMSGVVIKTGIYGLLRLISWLGPLPRACALIVISLAVVTGIMGILYALAQRQYKRMLAYSSVENIGIIVLGIGLGMLGQASQQPILAALGFGGALLHVLNHALFKGLLFLSAGAVLHGTGVSDIERLGGLARRDPFNAVLFATGCLAICALPPLNGFAGEFLIYSGLLRGAETASLPAAAFALIGVAALALIGGLALAGFSKLFGVMFLGEPRDANVVSHATPWPMLAGMSILAVGCIVVGLGAPFVGGVLRGPLAAIGGARLDAGEYMKAVLSPLAWVSAVGLFATGMMVVLIVLRRRLTLSGPAAARPVTWGCGYAAPMARMQYTGSSYAWKLIRSFRSLVRPQRIAILPEGCFAARASLTLRTEDAAVRMAYQPFFRAVARACGRLWPLQHGRIQLYLMYIVGTLLIVFVAEAWHSPFSGGKQHKSPVSAAIRLQTDGHGGPQGGVPVP